MGCLVITGRGDFSLEKQVVSPSCLTLGLFTAAFVSAARQTLKGGMALNALMEKVFFFLLFCAQREKILCSCHAFSGIMHIDC